MTPQDVLAELRKQLDTVQLDSATLAEVLETATYLYRFASAATAARVALQLVTVPASARKAA